MLLKEQKAKFSFLASDEEDEEDKLRGSRLEGRAKKGRAGNGAGENTGVNQAVNSGDKERGKGDRDRDGLRKRGKGTDSRKSPAEPLSSTPASSTYSPHVPAPDEPLAPVGPAETDAVPEESTQDVSSDAQNRTGAHTPPYNGQSQVSGCH